jgi:phenylalanyl-tRNA synthetase beta chain
MKVPLSWLRELVEIEVPLGELRHRLTMAGLEVEELREVGGDWRDVILGRVVDLQPHPRRDGLRVATIDLADRRVTVVTGASNLTIGDVVPHVAPGGRLPSGEVGRRDFAGIVSEGMVCSGDELDISPDREGIYVLEADAPVGQSLAEYLQEVIFDIYITANRPDCMSMMGIAREVHALFGSAYTPGMAHLRDPATAMVAGSAGQPLATELLSVQIDDPDGCARFSASVLRGIQIRRSPRWLERRLHFAGVRPISNVVDVTNYVMLEVGQPLHAFDGQRLGSNSVVVRRALPGERLRTLDGAERSLTAEMMVVTDGRRARSLAGVMGGEDSEISDATSDVILEGASWDRATIRRTSAALTLSSEASRRFGRGVDPDLTTLGVARATELALELAGGSAAIGIADTYPGKSSPRSIDVQPRQIDALLGMSVARGDMLQTLERLGFEPEDRADEGVRVTVPGWRRFDVEGAADLAEEVGRIAGFDRVPTTMPTGPLPAPRIDGDRGYSDEWSARQLLAAAGLQEVITYSLVDPALASLLTVQPWETPVSAAPVRVANPQSVELSELRSELLGSLLLALRSNLRQRDQVQLFELASIWQGALDSADVERRHIGIAMSGARNPRYWGTTDGEVDFYDLKGVVDALCAAFHVDVSYVAGEHRSLHPGRTAEVCTGSTRLGILGQVHPTVAERLDLGATTAPVMFAEIDFDRLVQCRQLLFTVRTPSRFPPADRDISFIVDESSAHADLEPVIRAAAGDLLERVELFDVFRGGAIPAGRKSLAFSLRYRAPDRTLEDEEVNAAHARVEQALRARFAAEVRGRA